MKNTARTPDLLFLHTVDGIVARCFSLVAKSYKVVSHTPQQLIPLSTTIIHHRLNHADESVCGYAININEVIWEGNQALFFIKIHTLSSLDHLTD